MEEIYTLGAGTPTPTLTRFGSSHPSGRGLGRGRLPVRPRMTDDNPTLFPMVTRNLSHTLLEGPERHHTPQATGTYGPIPASRASLVRLSHRQR